MSSKTRKPLPTLVATVGLPRSGKSTWIRKQPPAPIVEVDAIRLALTGQRFYHPAEAMVWASARLMVESLFGAGHALVYLDACNHTRARRSSWINGGFRTKWKVLDTDCKECIKRAIATHQLNLTPIIEKMQAEWQPLYGGEQPYIEDVETRQPASAADCETT